LRKILASEQAGLVLVIFVLGILLTGLAGSHVDRLTGAEVNNFLNSYTLIQTATDASFFAIMAVGATIVIISGGIDLSVGSIYALAGVTMALVLRALGPMGPFTTFIVGLVIALGIGIACGALNGLMVVGLRVHPFVITLGTMWILRGVAFVASHAESILVPPILTRVAKASLGMGSSLYPVPMLTMIVVTAVGAVYLTRTVMGRHVFAIGGNAEASRFSGLRLWRIQNGVFVISGLTAGLAAFMGASFYGSASCVDATGYELYVIASAVVGGASLSGGRGSVIGAVLGALIFGVLRNALAQIPGATFYDRMIVGVVVIVIVVMDQMLVKRGA